jgi:uncharacterized protein
MSDEMTPYAPPPEAAPPGASPDITQDDKLWGALSYFPIVAIIMLLIEEKRNRPFIKFNAIQAIALAVALVVINFIVGLIPFIRCLSPLIWLVMLWPAINAFSGKYTEIPVITSFIKNQGWV